MVLIRAWRRRNSSRRWTRRSLLRAGKRHPHGFLVDQGTADNFYPAQLLTDHLRDACVDANQPATINLREGYDHSYYFIASHIAAHVAFHAARLLELP